MIDFLRGKLVHQEKDYVVLDVNGVGYRVFSANPYAVAARENVETTLYIHHHVREDAILLYGFYTRDEQSLFRRLLDVSGIGPKVALGILSGGTTDAIIRAVQSEDIAFLTRLPGIGKKTAQRMILDLKDKLDSIVLSAPALSVEDIAENRLGSDLTGPQWSEVKQALTALGYTDAEADRAVAKVKPGASDKAQVDELIKLCLKELYKG